MIVRSYVKKADFDTVRLDFLSFHEHPTWLQMSNGDYIFSILVKNHAEKMGASSHSKAVVLPSPGNPNPIDPAILDLFPALKTSLGQSPGARPYHLIEALHKAHGNHHLLDPDY
jgi:hypothetical protein